MRDDDRLDELPEAVPLHRIAPFWRLIATRADAGDRGDAWRPCGGLAALQALERRDPETRQHLLAANRC